MSMTNVERRRQAKRKAKERSARRQSNLKRNTSRRKFRLDVELDGEWHKGVMWFRDVSEVNAYRVVTERRRRAGEQIAAGRVYDAEAGEFVMEIPGSKSKGAAPDKITDGVRADPDVTAKADEKPDEPG